MISKGVDLMVIPQPGLPTGANNDVFQVLMVLELSIELPHNIKLFI